VKAILAASLILALGITGISLWGVVHAQRMALSSSQIYIHGTPVCVIQQAGEITASVGVCGSSRGDSRGNDSGSGRGFHEEDPSTLEGPFTLPPGHPPIDSDPSIGEGRGTLI
jgi:hypothetical protein